MKLANYVSAGNIGDEFNTVTKWAVIGTVAWFFWTKTSLPRKWGLK
jgi:hypothetical protein